MVKHKRYTVLSAIIAIIMLAVLGLTVLTTARSKINIVTQDVQMIEAVEVNCSHIATGLGRNYSFKKLMVSENSEQIKEIYNILKNGMKNTKTYENPKEMERQESNPRFTVRLIYRDGKSDLINSTEGGKFIYRFINGKGGWTGGENEGLLPLIVTLTMDTINTSQETPQSEVAGKVENLLKALVENTPYISSNPYDYIKENPVFEELVALGKPALDTMLDIFAQSNEDGLKEYIMACACAKIMGVFDGQKGLGTSSGREWFYKYGAFEKDADFHIVDADYDLFKNTQGKPKLVLPAHTDMKNMEDVISNCILSKNRRAYRMGEKAIEAHEIYRTEEKDGIINVYMRVSFHWFGFESGAFTVVSGGGGEPIRMQLKKHKNGVYEILEYRQPMDGGLWEKSIRDMFPKDLADMFIKSDDKTVKELWNVQETKAREYLEKIERTDAPIYIGRREEKVDNGVGSAIYLVTLLRRDFPEWNGTREILVRTGGPDPGMNVRCVLETKCVSDGNDEYTITLTKTWQIKINGKQPVSVWKYRVTGRRVELVESQDNDTMIKIIK
ncbi:MAG: hypothetical protein M0021_00195 [Clostridia bacterium]|nr:hypothetical protein [Clostridia bacterium]